MYEVYELVWEQTGIDTGYWREVRVLETPDREEAKHVRDAGNFRYAVRVDGDEINFHPFLIAERK